jgi:hypothetical protein
VSQLVKAPQLICWDRIVFQIQMAQIQKLGQTFKVGYVIFFKIKGRDLSGGTFVKKRVMFQLVNNVDAFATEINFLHSLLTRT